MASNRELLASFFARIITVMSKESSDNYAEMVLRKFIKETTQTYPFAKYIHTSTLSANPKEIFIDKELDEIDQEKISEYIRHIVNSSFTDLLKHMVASDMPPGLVKEFNDRKVMKKYVWVKC